MFLYDGCSCCGTKINRAATYGFQIEGESKLKFCLDLPYQTRWGWGLLCFGYKKIIFIISFPVMSLTL